MRAKVLDDMSKSTSAANLKPVADHVYILLKSCSHRNFIRLGVANGTFETICMATGLGIVLTITGILAIFLLAFASPFAIADAGRELASGPCGLLEGGWSCLDCEARVSSCCCLAEDNLFHGRNLMTTPRYLPERLGWCPSLVNSWLLIERSKSRTTTSDACKGRLSCRVFLGAWFSRRCWNFSSYACQYGNPWNDMLRYVTGTSALCLYH